MDYKPSGVCSRLIHVELDGDKIANVEFVGGCAGNTAGISSLVKGMDAHEVIKRLEGSNNPTLEGAENKEDKIKKLLKQRDPVYEKFADIKVVTGVKPFDELHNYRKKRLLVLPLSGKTCSLLWGYLLFMYSYCKISIFIQCFVYLLQLLLF